MYTHIKDVLVAGTPVATAKRALIMLHGRGATAESIASLAGHLSLENTAIFAPRANNNSWYPYSFLAPAEDNQPALGSALQVIDEVVEEVLAAGIPSSQVYFLGFSQGACLSLEYVARNAKRYGGVVAFTGGLIGETLNPANYPGEFEDTPVLITTSDPDPHVPLTRVQESVTVLEAQKAVVTLKVYPGKMHSIQLPEITLANELVFGPRSSVN